MFNKIRQFFGTASQNTYTDFKNISSYRLQTVKKIDQINSKDVGSVYMVTKDNFPALEGVTCYTLEVWEECMRIPHWHPNASELGYVLSGSIEVIIWRSPGETAVFTLTPGMCWFIPKSALHSLNNIGKEKAKLLVGFSCERPKDIDLTVAFNGIPVPIREVYTSPHSELRNWQGVKDNPLVGRFNNYTGISSVLTGSPYGFDLSKAPPLFEKENVGSVVWGVKSNWSILNEISVLRAILEPGTARDPIWYPDVGTLYVVSKGEGKFRLIISGFETDSFAIKLYDYIFVPMGILHTFINDSSETLELIAFFTNENPLPEVSLSVSTGFFPNNIRRAALTKYDNEHQSIDPLKDLKNTNVSPYLLKLPASDF